MHKFNQLNTKSISKRRLIIVFLLIVFITTLAIICINRPSEEMAHLRKIESELSLPAHTKRVEDDRGTYKDINNQERSSINITIYFDSQNKVEQGLQSVESKNKWGQTMSGSYDNGRVSEYLSPETQTCIYAESYSANGENSNFIVIRSKSDDNCQALKNY